ncbi:glycosyltransferase family 2 protein [Neptunitalea lumnitzerae]|uniref:Beta 1,4 glucosyltransferase n=1 Tax=Neptunitalea lumnitzerae TaxID=2965509 RepID=A0ABQ5MKM2_9FLAO|nr:glycosyltransferase family 2 protein [Neptunitalea sp. Y10]GLB49956.1 beta 1,4 glucosyltransferase [Neptunitalea sp. Y10]
MHKLSAVLITLNEINCIETCIDSISFADELIVVDSYSTDGTWEFLQNHPQIKAYQNTFKNYTDQKSFALNLASNNWVLFVDADEVVTTALKNEIKDVLKAPKADAYYVYRKFIMNNVPLKFCGFQTDKQLRLFNKSKAHFVPNKLVHEKIISKGSEAFLKNKLDHNFYKSEEDYKRRIKFYGTLKGQEIYQKKRPATIFHSLFKPSFKFFYMYIIRLGILDGRKGYKIASINAKGVAERYKEIKRIKKRTT